MIRFAEMFISCSSKSYTKVISRHPRWISYRLRRGMPGEENKQVTPFGWLLLIIPTTTFGLGCWQIKRKFWKENLIKEIDQRKQLEPTSLPENLENFNQLEYRKVKVRGKFQHDKELYIGPRSFIRPDGLESVSSLFSQRDLTSGYLVVTPFKLTNRDETILVNRGWVSRKNLSPNLRKSAQISDEVNLTGVVRLNESRLRFSPDQKGNIFLRRDLEKMCAQTGASPYFIDADYESSVPGGPIGGQTRITLHNDHLSYVITWFGISAATSMLWYRQILKKIPF